MAEEKRPPGTYPDKETAKAIYMGSPKVSWSEFCNTVDWNPMATRQKYPVAMWTAEKRKHLAEIHADEIVQSVFDHRIRYRKDVLATLRDYPVTSDAIHELIRHRVTDIMAQLKANPKATRKVILKGKEVEIPLLDSEELVRLAMAQRTIVEAKHKSLLLDAVVARVAADAPAQIETPDDAEEREKAQGFNIEVIGMGKVTLAQLQSLNNEFLDKPSQKALPPPSTLDQASPQTPGVDPLQALIDGDADVQTPR